MKDTTLILLAAGSSSRFGLPVKKQWLYLGDRPLWVRVAEAFEKTAEFARIILSVEAGERSYMGRFADYTFVDGGSSRQESLSRALEAVETPWVLVGDIARCCVDEALVERVLKHKGEAACIAPALEAVDTVYEDGVPVDRRRIRLIQTPQLSRTEILRRALAEAENFTDESSAIHALGEEVLLIEGSSRAHKLTHLEDLRRLDCLEAPSRESFTGFGLDVHAFETGKEMKLGGITIDAPMGFKAHSDGDVAIHALIDALLGAAGMGDIGEHFPDTDPRWKDADSMELLDAVLGRIRGCGLEPRHADLTILAQTPRLGTYKEAIRRKLAKALDLPPNRVNIKATTAEKMGFVGRKEGVAVHAVATLGIYDWRSAL
ncbi:bifunctional 2-C-methyl-D-erythritol 4-phosphate cytidylyltransferase/2-C-methyl-D-erythritol 2,4-cyclodiphosphate synthase [Nitratifractor sp.]